MTQTEARAKARELGGIAVEARRGKDNGWVVGGWPNQLGSTWIVINLSRTRALAE